MAVTMIGGILGMQAIPDPRYQPKKKRFCAAWDGLRLGTMKMVSQIVTLLTALMSDQLCFLPVGNHQSSTGDLQNNLPGNVWEVQFISQIIGINIA